MAQSSKSFSLLALSVLLLLSSGSFAQGQGLSASCPSAESIIQQTVQSHFDGDNTILAGILRLHFHDCFVNGCDASLLLESTPTDGTDVEMFAPPNSDSLRGFEVIDEAKTALEQTCPGVVSCADTLAIAARDAVVMLGMQHYDVPTGRFDGTISSSSAALSNLPAPTDSFDVLKSKFSKHDLSVDDLVLLSGGHTIGTSQCRFFEDRVYDFNGSGTSDPSLDSTYAGTLRSICSPQGASPSPKASLDDGSEFSFDSSYYQNLLNNEGVLESDQILASHAESSDLVNSLAQNPSQFLSQFADSMIKMGNIGWKTSSNGEIRLKCNQING